MGGVGSYSVEEPAADRGEAGECVDGLGRNGEYREGGLVGCYRDVWWVGCALGVARRDLIDRAGRGVTEIGRRKQGCTEHTLNGKYGTAGMWGIGSARWARGGRTGHGQHINEGNGRET